MYIVYLFIYMLSGSENYKGDFVPVRARSFFSDFFSDFSPCSSPDVFPMCSEFVSVFHFGPPGLGTRVNRPTWDPTKGGTSLAQTDF